MTPGDQLTFAAQADPAASDASGSAAASAAVQTDDRLDALNELQAKLEEYGMLDDVTRMEFADTDQMAFLIRIVSVCFWVHGTIWIISWTAHAMC